MREENQAANVPKLLAATDTSPNSPPPVAPVDDTTALALRSRFKEHLCLEFASEVLRQIQRRRESRDDRGKPLMLGSDAKLIVDKASVVAASLAKCAITDTDRSCRFTESPALRSLLFAGSQRVLGHAIDTFDPRRPEQFLPTDAVDELILTECQTLLEESHARSEFTAAITSLIELDRVTESTVECATSDPLQCGGDRRDSVVRAEEKGTLGRGKTASCQTARGCCSRLGRGRARSLGRVRHLTAVDCTRTRTRVPRHCRCRPSTAHPDRRRLAALDLIQPTNARNAFLPSASQVGGVRAELRGHYVRLPVADAGIGQPEEYGKRVLAIARLSPGQ